MNSRTPLTLAASAGACALALGVTAPAMAAPAAGQDDKAMVPVFHGVPGLVVDVYANGDELLGDFKPGAVTAPQSLDAGTYDIQVFAAGKGPDGTPAIEKTIEVPAGANATIAAHLSADGKPQLTAFVNDVSKIDAGKARLTVRHVGAAPAVDVRAGGQPVFKDLENPKEATTTVDTGTVSADVVLAGTNTVAIGPADLNLKEGTSNVVYAWGSAQDKNLALATQPFSGMQSAPNAVNAGAGGAAVTSNSSDQWLARTAVAGTVTVTGVLVARRINVWRHRATTVAGPGRRTARVTPPARCDTRRGPRRTGPAGGRHRAGRHGRPRGSRRRRVVPLRTGARRPPRVGRTRGARGRRHRRPRRVRRTLRRTAKSPGRSTARRRRAGGLSRGVAFDGREGRPSVLDVPPDRPPGSHTHHLRAPVRPRRGWLLGQPGRHGGALAGLRPGEHAGRNRARTSPGTGTARQRRSPRNWRVRWHTSSPRT
ncbi:hypothetical protein GCM10010346_56620 [Streptomyces chryseus]|uniref:DUF4397 domain-containing protein n=1 Tax=Streptomyces chryseus TaxID=68186 RepID=A0ABQ3E4I1_9ACTN|nr:hypothetical protein GCM10010346_56620 [Streptomyces chryseus]